MELRAVVFFLFALAPVLTYYVEIQRHYEFEDALDEDQQQYWVWRSEASSLKTLRLEDPHRRYLVEFKICIEPIMEDQLVVLVLDDIRYSNDGPNDIIFVTFENELWATTNSYEKWAYGHDWNIFRNTGRLGDPKFLTRGEYVIGVSVITDKWGFEFDKIRLNAEFQEISSTLICGSRFRTLD